MDGILDAKKDFFISPFCVFIEKYRNLYFSQSPRNSIYCGIDKIKAQYMQKMSCILKNILYNYVKKYG